MYLPGFNFCFTSISCGGCVGGEGLNIFELIFMCFYLVLRSRLTFDVINRRGGSVVERLPRKREIGVGSPVATDLYVYIYMYMTVSL